MDILCLTASINLWMEAFSLFMMVEIDPISCYRKKKLLLSKTIIQVKGVFSPSCLHALCQTNWPCSPESLLHLKLKSQKKISQFNSRDWRDSSASKRCIFVSALCRCLSGVSSMHTTCKCHNTIWQ
jgi:hypothetical protein